MTQIGPNPGKCFGGSPPHPCPSPARGEGMCPIHSAEGNSGAPSPLGERAGVRGAFAKRSTRFAILARPYCLLRIGVSQIQGAWLAGGEPGQAGVAFGGEAQGSGPSVGDAIAAVLSQILPQRRLMSPHVSVGLAGAHVAAGIMAFANLPGSAKDRSLLISHRFCRENRLDPASITVRGSPLGPAENGGEAVLCVGVSNALLAEIAAALAANRLYADEIAPDYMLSFAEAGTRELEAPGMVLMRRPDGATILVWDGRRTIVHVASYASGDGGEDGRRRMASRIFRYARIVGAEGETVAVYADGAEPEELSAASGGAEHGLKFLHWPSGRGPWAQQIAAAGL